MRPFVRSTWRFHPYALLRWVLVCALGIGLSLASLEQAMSADPSIGPATSAASPTPSEVPSVVEEARAAKRDAGSYEGTGALSNASASWMQAAHAYERAGNYGEAALAWTERSEER